MPFVVIQFEEKENLWGSEVVPPNWLYTEADGQLMVKWPDSDLHSEILIETSDLKDKPYSTTRARIIKANIASYDEGNDIIDALDAENDKKSGNKPKGKAQRKSLTRAQRAEMREKLKNKCVEEPVIFLPVSFFCLFQLFLYY